MVVPSGPVAADTGRRKERTDVVARSDGQALRHSVEVVVVAEVAATAADMLRRMLETAECPIPEWSVLKYKLRCKSMATEAAKIASEWSRWSERRDLPVRTTPHAPVCRPDLVPVDLETLVQVLDRLRCL